MAVAVKGDDLKIEQMSPSTVIIRQKIIQDLTLDMDTDSDTFFVKRTPFRAGDCSWLVIVSCKKESECFELQCSLSCPSHLDASLPVKYRFALHRSQMIFVEHTGSHQFTNTETSYQMLVATFATLDHLFGFCDDLTFEVIMAVGEPELDEENKFKKACQVDATNALNKALGSLLDSGAGDVGFFFVEDCSGIKAHRAILMARSPVFQKLLSGGSDDAIICIKDIGSAAFKIMLSHVYTGVLALPEGIDEGTCKKVVIAAEKYGFQDLKKFAALVLMDFATKENCLHMLKFAIDHEAEEARDKLLTFVQEYPEPIFHLLSF